MEGGYLLEDLEIFRNSNKDLYNYKWNNIGLAPKQLSVYYIGTSESTTTGSHISKS